MFAPTNNHTMPVKPRKLPSQETLREYFSYDPGTGLLTRNELPRSRFKSDLTYALHLKRDAGKVVGSKNARGYLFAKAGGTTYPVQRIVWALFAGPIPDGYYVDHINGVRDDNRFTNLRLVTWEGSQHNAKTRKDNSLGQKHIRQIRSGRYWVRLKHEGKQKSIGTYDTIEQAIAARDKARLDIRGDNSDIRPA